MWQTFAGTTSEGCMHAWGLVRKLLEDAFSPLEDPLATTTNCGPAMEQRHKLRRWMPSMWKCIESVDHIFSRDRKSNRHGPCVLFQYPRRPPKQDNQWNTNLGPHLDGLESLILGCMAQV